MSEPIEIKVNITSRATHRGLERSTTLNRRYVKRPTKLIVTDGTEEIEEALPKVAVKAPRKVAILDEKDIAKEQEATGISHIAKIAFEEPALEEVAIEEPEDLPPAPNPYQAAIDARKAKLEKQKAIEVDSRALKEAAIEKAMREMEENRALYKTSKAELREERIAEKVMLSEMEEDIAKNVDKKAAKAEKKTRRKAVKVEKHIKKRKTGRVLLALATSAACIFALAALVKVNLPNISVKVAAVQTGVEASYPSYVPRDFSLSGVYTNDKNDVIIEFKGPNDSKFTLNENKSSWDSNALLTNYVRGAYGSNYDTIRENGITIYVSASNASWVNNGIFYRITATNGTLTKKQIKNIATSL
ncbi:hypothetical protein J6W91_02180 [Candidatus Saccharibacteria bacterium]|nr:hypothetical protein [Candidatus Saccharibacteria bacterium]